MIRKLVLILPVLLLSSCCSFNTTTLRSYELAHGKSGSRADEPKPFIRERVVKGDYNPKPKVIVRTKLVHCPKFVLPDLGEEPASPIKQLVNVNPNDYKSIDKIVMDYVDSLTQYVRDKKKEIQLQYQLYLTDYDKTCK